VGEGGQGDDYGLGSHESHTVLEIAHMFGGEITMLPERPGNRMDSICDTTRAEKEFGWKTEQTVEAYIESLKAQHLTK
jgi:UDP-glucose 4-epimerase